MPLTPYTTNIPLATQPINQTQQAINDNFTALVNNATPANGLFTVNHVGTSDPTDYGKHKFAQFPVQAAAPATAANELALYSKTVAAVSHLFLRQPTNGTEIDLSLVTTATAANVTTQTFYLPNGLIIKTGSTSGSKLLADVGTLITFPVAFPTSCLSVVISQLLNNNTTSPNNILHIVSYTAAAFTVFNRVGTGGFATDITFFAIGN